MDVKGKRVTVIGLGNSGINAALLLDSMGADVRVTDSQSQQSVKENARLLEARSIGFEIGSHTEGFIKGSDLIVVSPGVSDDSPAVRWATQHNIPMMGEMELGFRFCKGRVIAVTGTNGKSTVTTLIGQMLKDGGRDVCVCGNIGNSLCGEIARIKHDTLVVLEVSSFQLEKTALFKPYISIILNITDDHMDRYKVFSDYFNEKLKVFMNQDRDDILILNHDADKIGLLKNVAHSKVMFYSRLNKPGKDNGICCYVSGGSVRCAVGGRDAEICAVSDIKLKGVHNIENMLACCLAAVLTGIGAASIRKTIINFTGLRHRFETVDTIEGVEYVDDSKGTTVDSTLRALESCEKPVVLIAGGRDKNSYYSVVRETVKKKVRHLILIGEARKAIAECLKDVVPIHEANGMLEAVRLARRLSDKGSMVLLSPMCSSFDMFRDYKERGEVFAAAVKSLRQTFRESEI